MREVEVVAKHHPPAHSNMDHEVLGEFVSLTDLAGVIISVGPVLTLDEGSVDFSAN